MFDEGISILYVGLHVAVQQKLLLKLSGNTMKT